MKRYLTFLVFIILASCTSDNLEEYYGEVDCEAKNITYSDDIVPIINANCAVSGCHVSGTGLPDWTKYENLADKAQKVKQYTSEGIMPPSFSGRSLTIEQVQTISCWVDSGAPNN